MVLYYALSQYLSGTESLDVWMGGWVERWWGHFVGPRLVPHVLGIHSARYSILHYFQYSMGTESLGGWVDGPPNNIYIYIACLRQVVAFAPKVLIACLRQGFCIRKTR